MSTQMNMARRGLTTEEMIQVAKDEDVDLDLLIQSCKRFYNYSKK
jgi:thiamine biosynthesis protein ThiC